MTLNFVIWSLVALLFMVAVGYATKLNGRPCKISDCAYFSMMSALFATLFAAVLTKLPLRKQAEMQKPRKFESEV